MYLINVMLSKRRQMLKNTYYVILFTQSSKRGEQYIIVKVRIMITLERLNNILFLDLDIDLDVQFVKNLSHCTFLIFALINMHVTLQSNFTYRRKNLLFFFIL